MDYNFEDKKSTFITALKESYTRQYKAVQPIPNRREKLLSVEEVFVGCGVEQQDKTDTTTWNRLASYHEIFRDDTSKTKRRVIEGEPGYGKSTLTLQIAYDWCNNVKDSSVKDIEILIILKLRQLYGVKSIYEAIKRLLVSNKPDLAVSDIERIINECSSVHFILDGYDEYPYRQTDENNEVQNIIKGNMMKETEVTLLTRNIECLERDLPRKVQRFRLTGFDEKAKDQYLQKVVVEQDDRAAADRIKRVLRENYFLDDFCQIPLIFVLFAHMVYKKPDFKQNMKTVTSIFRYIVSLFHDHRENKTADPYVSQTKENFANSHDVLDKLALEGLRKGLITWKKNDLILQLGQDFYDQYVSAGILVEDILVDDIEGADGDIDINEVTGTRFFHKLLCEWYAAHSLVKESNIRNVFQQFDPFELQFLFRFACGIRKEVFKDVNESLGRKHGTELLITLCLFESTDDEVEFLKTIRGICTREVTFNQELSKLGQRSMIQMLEIASNNKISVTGLNILGTVASVDKNGIVLLSGLRLQRLLSVEKIRILEQAHQRNVHEMKRLPEEDVLNFFTYIQQLELIQQLSLEGFVLPPFINPENLSFTFRSEGVKVYWTPRFTTVKLSLNLQSGLWKVSDKNAFQKALAQIHEDQRRGNRQLYDVLHTIASYNDILVEEFILDASFLTADETETTWRLNLGSLLNAERVVVCPEHNQLLSNEELAKIINFVKLSKRIRQLRFQPNQVPIEFPDSLLCSLRTSSCNSYVFCKLTGVIDFCLNFITGRWELEVSTIDQLGFRFRNGVLPLESTDSVSCRWATLHMLKIASRNNIPVPVVVISDDVLSADEGKLVFNSGDPLEASPVIEELVFDCANLQFNTDLMSGLLKYANKSERLQQLRFCECIVPSPMSLDSIPLNLRARNFQVTWKCKNVEFDMNLLSGHWEVKNLMDLMKTRSQSFVINVSHDSLQQVELVQMMLIAARQAVRIQSLQLVNSFLNVEDNKITLSTEKKISKLVQKIYLFKSKNVLPHIQSIGITDQSIGYGSNVLYIRSRQSATIGQTPEEVLPDVILPPIESLKKLEIISTTEKEMSTSVLLKISRFGQQCKVLEEIRITDILLSGSLSSNLIPSVPIIWSLQVPFGGLRWDYRLNSGMARWEFEDIQTLRKLCESPIYLRGSDRKLIQASTIQIMEVACSYDVTVSCLVLDESLRNIEGGCIALTSGLSVPSLPSLKKLVVISGVDKTLSESEVSELISCSQMFKQLQEICFNDKVLPLHVSSETAKRVPRNFKVCWGHYGYKLAPENCLWEVDDDNVLRELCSSTVVIHKDDDQSLHECQKLLLINASNHQIPVTRLALNQSFSKSTEDSIILSSGSWLPHLSTVEEIELWMEQGHKIEEDELIAILEYGGKCKELRHIRFFGCLLPYQIHQESISSLPSMDNIQVTWLAYRLNLKTGTWQNKETLTDLTEDQYKTKIEVMQKRRDTSHL